MSRAVGFCICFCFVNFFQYVINSPAKPGLSAQCTFKTFDDVLRFFIHGICLRYNFVDPTLRMKNKQINFFMKYFIAAFLLFFSPALHAQDNASPDFLVKPYLQLGKKPSPRSMQLLWHSATPNEVWLAEYKNTDEAEWKRSENQAFSTVAVGKVAPFYVYTTSFTSLRPGTIFHYRVSKNGKIVFSSEATSLKSPDQSYRVAISGDMGAGSNTARKIAYEIHKVKPDMLTIAGDIVYNRGLVSEYTTRFWPVYNKD